jgi:hypothetical protein
MRESFAAHPAASLHAFATFDLAAQWVRLFGDNLLEGHGKIII